MSLFSREPPTQSYARVVESVYENAEETRYTVRSLVLKNPSLLYGGRLHVSVAEKSLPHQEPLRSIAPKNADTKREKNAKEIVGIFTANECRKYDVSLIVNTQKKERNVPAGGCLPTMIGY